MPPEPSSFDRADLQRLALEAVATGSPEGSLLQITVTGASMAPALLPGDAILVRSGTPADLKPGALVTFLTGSGPVTHRVVRLGPGDRITTKGDHSRNLDTPIDAGQIVGQVLASTRADSTRDLRPGTRAVWTARLSLLEGRVTAIFNPRQRATIWFRMINLPFRKLVSIASHPGLSR